MSLSVAFILFAKKVAIDRFLPIFFSVIEDIVLILFIK